jgi:selenocysteine-specific elongation factor
MAHDGILGTAGHIDHGKTALVRVLTGVDCDRLPEEKTRGITIDLGFASLQLGEHRFGIVDVPGHERFVKNMLAGATGFDAVLFVVAADDGLMPQSREHLEILEFLGVSRGVIALTKCDLVDADMLELRTLEVREWLAGTRLQNAPIVACSSVTGQGMDELRARLQTIAEELVKPENTGPFRLSIDRVFTAPGHGTVVTGTVMSGQCHIEAELSLLREDGIENTVRIRGLNRHDTTVVVISEGQRAALNLAGVTLDEVQRGDVLATPGTLTPSRLISVRLHPTKSGRAIKHRLPVRLHLGTAEVVATVSLLDADRVEAGSRCFAQLHLQEHVATVWGQRFVLRDSSGQATLGGGWVLQASAEKIRRGHVESLEMLEALDAGDASQRDDAELWFAGWAGLPTPSGLRLHPKRIEQIAAHLLAALQVLHAEQPLMTTHDRATLLARCEFLPPATANLVLDAMVRDKKLLADGKRIARMDFQPRLNAKERKLKDRIVAEHLTARFEPPEVKNYLPQVTGDAKKLSEILDVAVAEGLLVKVSAELFLHAEVEAEMQRVVREKLATGQGATVAEVRDWLKTTRKFAVPFCEHLDRIGVTRRDGDLRFLAISSS